MSFCHWIWFHSQAQTDYAGLNENVYPNYMIWHYATYACQLFGKSDAALASDNNMVTVFLYRETSKQNEANVSMWLISIIVNWQNLKLQLTI